MLSFFSVEGDQGFVIKPEESGQQINLLLEGEVPWHLAPEWVGKLHPDINIQFHCCFQALEIPFRQLEGFRCITLIPGESRKVEFILTPRPYSMKNSGGERVIESGWFTITLCGGQPGNAGAADLPEETVVSGHIKITGTLSISG